MQQEASVFRKDKTNAARPEKILKRKLRDDSPSDFEVGFEESDKKKSPKQEREPSSVNVFLNAIENRDIGTAYVLLRSRLRFDKRAYRELKDALLSLIDFYLEQSRDLAEKYRTDLVLLRAQVLNDAWEQFIPNDKVLSELSAWGRARCEQLLLAKGELVKKEVVIARYFALIVERDMDAYAIFFQLAKARELGLPDFTDMKKRFLNRLNVEISRDAKDLENAAKLHLLKLKQEVEEWR